MILCQQQGATQIISTVTKGIVDQSCQQSATDEILVKYFHKPAVSVYPLQTVKIF